MPSAKMAPAGSQLLCRDTSGNSVRCHGDVAGALYALTPPVICLGTVVTSETSPDSILNGCLVIFDAVKAENG